MHSQEYTVGESTTLPLVQREVARIINVEDVDTDTGVGELGIDSLNVVELILVFEQLYQKPVDPDELHVDQFTTLRELDQQLLAMGTGATAGEPATSAG
jgi:acyl carrier protein